MKKIFCLVFALATGMLCAQNKEQLYDFTDVPQSLLLNPGAEVNFKSHVGVPFLSHIHVNAGSSGASAYDVFANDGRSINEKIEETLTQLGSRDYFTVNQQLEILNFGWRSKNDVYYSGGIYEELDVIAYFPKDFAVLAYEGNRDFVGETFRLSTISATAELMSVFHFGYNKQVNSRLRFGGRLKLYSSIFNARSVRNRGTFTTIESPNGNNIYQHIIRGADVRLQTAGYASLRDIESEDNADGAKQVLNKFLNRALLGGNLGIGVDLGFTYDIEDQWKVTGSVTDLGMIFYTKDVETYKAIGDYTFEGLNLPIDFSGDQSEEQDVLDDLEEAVSYDTIHDSYSAFRPMKLNGSVRYSFNRYRSASCDCYLDSGKIPYMDGVGAQVFMQFRPRQPQLALSLFYDKRFSKYFRTKINYTIDDYSYSNIGFMLSTYVSKINFYLAANNVLEYQNLAKARGASVQLGFNIIM
ncbi:DUF5723 family protein [Aquimarina rhabdastrellae]